MNGIEKITARIETEAVADAARMAQEIEAQCAEIRTEGEARAQESYWRRFKEGVKSAEDRVQRLNKAADMEARKSILSYKQGIVAEVFDLAEKKLKDMAPEAYVDFLAGQAARASVSGQEELILNGADKKAYGDKVLKKANGLLEAEGRPARLTLAPEEGDFSGGVIVRDGSVSVNCTIEALIAQARVDMASQAAAELFE